MNKRGSAIFLVVFFTFLFCGACSTVNQGLDSANEGAREAGKPVGKVLKVPGSAMEGAAEGIATTEKEDNPYGR